MAKIYPFCGVRYNPERTAGWSEVTAPPYDVISSEQRNQYAEQSEHNVVHLILPEGKGDERYQVAGKLLRDWLSSEVLVKEQLPAIYVYSQGFEVEGVAYERTGFISLIQLEPFENKVVLPHEKTLSKPKEDRLKLMRACMANLSQVFGMYADPTGTDQEVFNKVKAAKPDVFFTDDEGVTHSMWVVTDQKLVQTLRTLLEDKQVYIADGHHRYETALNLKGELGQGGSSAEDGFNYCMMMFVNTNDPGMVVLPTHRMVHTVPDWDFEKFLRDATQYFSVQKWGKTISNEENLRDFLDTLEEQSRKDQKCVLGFYAQDEAYILTLIADEVMKEFYPDKPEAWRKLDVAILHSLVFERMFGLTPESQSRQENLNYTRCAAEVVSEVDRGVYEVGVFMNPTPSQAVSDVANAGETMPQKSTYFYPKLASGLVFYDLTDRNDQR
jgi:uncharacterized protein (DUF1015 family)